MIKLTRQQTAMLAEVNSRSHWLMLSPDLRAFLDPISVDKWPSILAESKLLGSLDRIAREKEACALVRSRLTEIRAAPGKVAFGPLVKGFVACCARVAGVRCTAQYFGLYDPQVYLWRKEEAALSAKDLLQRFRDEIPKIAQRDDEESAEIPQKIATLAVEEKVSPLKQDGFSKLQEALQRFAGKTKRRYSPSEKRAILALADEFGSKEVHEKLAVSYDTIARLQRRAGRKSPTSVGEIPARYGLIVEVMKRHPGMGPMQIRDWIARHHAQRMGVNTVREVMERAGWVPPLVRKKEFRPGQFRRYEAVRRNVLWHGDFLHVFINSCKVYILFVQDDHSRFIVGHGTFEGERFEAVLNVLQESIGMHGRPECFMADRGSAFWSWRGVAQLTRYLEEIGVDQHVAIEARVNGKVENLNQQVQKELFDVRRFTSLAELEAALMEWVVHFNFRRCHQGLAKLQVPADRFFPGALGAYTQAMDKHRGEGEMLRVLQEIITATRGWTPSPAASLPHMGAKKATDHP